jgi:ferredoxin, 2Fe-2S
MVEIVIENMNGLRIQTTATRPLLFLLQEHRIDWMHACGGKGRCTTCKALIIEGHHNLGPVTPAEERYKRLNALKEGERLACQVRVTGNIKIKVPEEGKLPHIKYSDHSEA